MALKILVFGSGSIGTVYAYILSRVVSPENIVCVCRSNYQAGRKNGFRIDSSIFGRGLTLKPQVVETVEQSAAFGPYDYVLVSTKAISTSPSYPSLLRAVVTQPTTTIVLLQNGIDTESEYASMYPNNPLLSCAVYLPVTQVSPAVFVHQDLEKLHVGTYPANAPQEHKEAAGEFVRLIAKGGGSAVLHDDIQLERWTKLLGNATWNPVCALTRSRDVQFLRSSGHAREYVRSVMYEISSVAQAAGYKTVSQQMGDMHIRNIEAKDLPGNEPSMLADALSGRRMEVDALLGNLLARADRHGVQTPLLRGLYAQIAALDESFGRRSGSKI
ncbi:2-dehydropantoate 2-reductase [Capronia epimyces CBS 606.96]|uniref:2-dehydropantoate 2-reductase n=1 Tax=Capronia epimyces CBS 606.96 TaxID=1182542 RepID=W9XGS0_9EURO|nr:2-dehydropantoate 2-reductase [Capronia epimyces CBS 606.96]EXJ79408.1 2-dehydropantoate 2-reductase [Capronia epimyces CBS 606.96]